MNANAKKPDRKPLLAAAAILLALTGLLLVWQAGNGRAAAPVVEIFYLPHRPALAVVAKVEAVAAEFSGIEVRKYSFEDAVGRRLAAEYGLTEHMPVALFINGRDRFTVAGRALSLRNFPKGDAFVPMYSGEWDYPDLRAILGELGGGRR